MAFSDTLKTKMAANQQMWILRLSLRAVVSQTDDHTWIPWAAGTLPPGDPAMEGVVCWGSSAPVIRGNPDEYLFPTFHVDPMTLKMAEQRLDITNWTCNGGVWSVELIWGDAQAALAWLVPGQLVELSIGWVRCAHKDFGRLAVGWIMNVDRLAAAGRYRITVYDLMAPLNGDIPGRSYPYGDPYIVHSMTDGHDYTAGDSELYVDDADAFDAATDPDGVYTLVIKPVSGEPFILKASSRSGGHFEGVSPAGQYGTTAIDVAAADGVVRVAYRLAGHPADVLMRMLTSTGTGTNGPYDLEPAPMGYGVPEELINLGDLATWAAVLDPPTVPFAIEIGVADLGTTESGSRPTTLTEGLRETQRRFGQAGIWLAFRQGHYVVRGLQDLYDDPVTSGMSIRLGQVVLGNLNFEYYTAERSEEFDGVFVRTQEGGASAGGVSPRLFIKHANGQAELDCTSFIWTDGTDSEVPQKILSRVRHWVENRLQRLRVVLGGLQWMQLCPGDLVSVNLEPAHFLGIDVAGRIANPDGSIMAYPMVMMVESIRCLLPKPGVAMTLLMCPKRDGEGAGPGGTVPALPS